MLTFWRLWQILKVFTFPKFKKAKLTSDQRTKKGDIYIYCAMIYDRFSYIKQYNMRRLYMSR